METGIGNFMKRKLIATSVSTIVTTGLLLFFSIQANPEDVYNQGNQFIGWFLFFLIYIGVIVLIYGNLVSIGVEYIQRKWFRQHDWLYVLIVGAFGSVIGVVLKEKTLAFYGMFAAILYAVIDKWLYKWASKNKRVKMLFLFPLAFLFIAWGYLQFISPPMPPFTKEKAVEFATDGSEGTTIEKFPKKIGKWEGTIDGYQVKRETNVQEKEDEVYMVTFTENWSKGSVKGYWILSYQVERGSSSASAEKGTMPPYYENN
ncbi:hypothetical protein [Neobacillus sp. SuZ13]|uniref:hypothetical protein n=1 Tax=Neobacillus sp. SuZ13 TaxID=3047875 RepID=UPI0024C045AE|nr:hypothetical protein [Neobacillus sp. SuZ13]WHY66838.1 hypothetical protein QNH17_28250 [Neobacillus sp. SuZ13]